MFRPVSGIPCDKPREVLEQAGKAIRIATAIQMPDTAQALPSG
jgi:hypothetical protein